MSVDGRPEYHFLAVYIIAVEEIQSAIALVVPPLNLPLNIFLIIEAIWMNEFLWRSLYTLSEIFISFIEE